MRGSYSARVPRPSLAGVRGEVDELEENVR